MGRSLRSRQSSSRFRCVLNRGKVEEEALAAVDRNQDLIACRMMKGWRESWRRNLKRKIVQAQPQVLLARLLPQQLRHRLLIDLETLELTYRAPQLWVPRHGNRAL